jgi:transposase
LQVLRKALFGRKSEKQALEAATAGQATFFDQAQPEATPQEIAEETAPASPATRRERKKRQKALRALPDSLPRVEILHPLPPDAACGTCGASADPASIRYDVVEKLAYRPGSIYVEKHLYEIADCSRCETVIKAEQPHEAIEGGVAAPSLLAAIAVSKYADHIPLCRSERIFARHGIELPRARMCDWILSLADLCQPLLKLMLQRLLASPVVASDDTSILVQQKGGAKKGYLWVYLGDASAPYTYYDFRMSRGRAGPDDILAGYRGTLQADAYSGYDGVLKKRDGNDKPLVLHAGCWAHARRYFLEALESGDATAQPAMDLIRDLYKIEADAREENLTDEQLTARRAARSRPILDNLKEWMKERPDVLPGSPLGKALGYAQGGWESLERFCGDGRIAIDNNAAERAIRPIAVGRKNWLFAGSERGGRAAAAFFTLIEGCRRNGVNPSEYLTDLFTRLPGHPHNRLEEFLPDRWQAARTVVAEKLG